LLLLIAFSSAALIKPNKLIKPELTKPLSLVPPKQNVGGVEFCKVCVSFMNNAIEDLIEIIGNAGIGATCQLVCSKLDKPIEQDICGILCEIVGIDAFIHIIDAVDPDPIAICEELTVCEHSTTAKASITSLTISPNSGPQGTTFQISLVYAVQNTIATGQAEVVIVPPNAFPFGGAENVYEQGVGNYGIRMSFQATPSENEPFTPGLYQCVAAVCEGSCGSPHKWSYTLSQSSKNFTITG